MTKQELDRLAINTIRTLSIDAVQEAKSGHPGTPMALAPLVYTLWNWVMRFDPQDPRSCWSLLIVRGGSSTSDRITSDLREALRVNSCFVIYLSHSA
jgi:Transketolase, thiamine diphosphate binding domain